jgi:septum site-determining protein MinC
MNDTNKNIPFELEGMVSTVTVLRLATDDLAAVHKALSNKLAQMPGFFQDAPVAIDLSLLEGTDEDLEGEAPPRRREVALDKLVALLKDLRLVPIGVRHLREARRNDARAAGLGVLRGSGRKPVKIKEIEEAIAPPAPAPAAPVDAKQSAQSAQTAEDERRTGLERRRETAPLAGSLVLKQQLRSGKVVYAEQCDAVALSSINPGAELIADGNIHVYGALRGRALAGAHGQEDARIFTRSLEADLVAIAGCYLRADEIPEVFRGKPAQVYLEDGVLKVGEL